MTSTKLSESEKQEIIRLYQEVPEETTITLAERYGVSSSTVRRVLQNAVPKDVYDILTTQKQRLHRAGKRSLEDLGDLDIAETQLTLDLETPEPVEVSRESTLILPRKRKRSSALESEPIESNASNSLGEDFIQTQASNYQPSTPGLEELLAKDLLDSRGHVFGDYEDNEDDEENQEDEEDEDGENHNEEDYLDEFGDDEDEDEDEDDNRHNLFSHSLTSGGTALVKILPLTETALPRTCYLVIDRSSELIAKPLRAFSELGTIPEEEILEKTLPVFDNHRVASRFSGRNQRVFKVPDGRLLRKAAPYLQAKGITRLLIDGQVYRF
ncbi:helix-turn-helix domain-containing protein [Planktothrix sp. FACHB-1365]|uniref:helix-turn-helix domain-containing protein n=1 Tax=Planktothrix sp. FACHB-1365 TaxID=2692855 RepID=UPI001682CAA6|nr:transcriptional regulator [Planktothrix sp. FACHB-1365]MBD2485664.1 transcriptional regulator [Planktothrix sp. FACHB-1365]